MPEAPILFVQPTRSATGVRCAYHPRTARRADPRIPIPASPVRMPARCRFLSQISGSATESGISAEKYARRGAKARERAFATTPRRLRSPTAGVQRSTHSLHRRLRSREESACPHLNYSPVRRDETFPANDIFLVLGPVRPVLVPVIFHHRAKSSVDEIRATEPAARVIPHLAVRLWFGQSRSLEQQPQQCFRPGLGSVTHQITCGCRTPRSPAVKVLDRSAQCLDRCEWADVPRVELIRIEYEVVSGNHKLIQADDGGNRQPGRDRVGCRKSTPHYDSRCRIGMMTDYATATRSPGVLGRRDVEGLVVLCPQWAAPQSGGGEMAEEVVRTEHRHILCASIHGGAHAVGARGDGARGDGVRSTRAGARTSHPHAGMRTNEIRASQSFRANTRLPCLRDREGCVRQRGR